MTAGTLIPSGDPWGAAADTADPSAPWPDRGSPEETLLQAAFAAAQRSIPADGSQPIGGPGSDCALTGDQLSLLLQEFAGYSMVAASHDLDLDEANKVLDEDAFLLFDLAHGGDVRGFAHRFARYPRRPTPPPPNPLRPPAPQI